MLFRYVCTVCCVCIVYCFVNFVVFKNSAFIPNEHLSKLIKCYDDYLFEASVIMHFYEVWNLVFSALYYVAVRQKDVLLMQNKKMYYNPRRNIWYFLIISLRSESPQVKRYLICSITNLVHELSHELPNDFRLRILGN